MKQVLLVLMILALITGITACGGQSSGTDSDAMLSGPYQPNQTQVAYAYTHGGYVGKAEVRVNAEGELSVNLDEAFLPHTLAIVDIEAPEWTEENTASYVSHGSTTYIAKYVEYNGNVYVAVPTGTGFSYVAAGENGEPAGGTDLEKEILRNQATMAAYFSLIQAGMFKVLDGFGGDATAVTTTHYGGVTKKNAPDYWNTGQTWAGNIKAIEDFIAENGVQYSLSEMVRAEEANADGLQPWSVADAVTAATNSDFKDYFGLVQLAAGRLKTAK